MYSYGTVSSPVCFLPNKNKKNLNKKKNFNRTKPKKYNFEYKMRECNVREISSKYTRR